MNSASGRIHYVGQPGAVETPPLHSVPGVDELLGGIVPLDPSDVARAVRFVFEQPPNVNVFAVLLRPTAQLL